MQKSKSFFTPVFQRVDNRTHTHVQTSPSHLGKILDFFLFRSMVGQIVLEYESLDAILVSWYNSHLDDDQC